MSDKFKNKLTNRRSQLKAIGGGLAATLAGCLGSGGGNGSGGNGSGGNGSGGNGSGGNGSGGNVKEPIEILTWNLGFLEKSINGWISDFEEKTGYKGAWVDQPAKDFPTYLQTQIQSGDPPEAIDTQGSIYVQYARDGVLHPLDDMVSDELLNRFNNSLIKRDRVDGTIWRLPFYFVSTGTVYRKKWFKNAGIAENLPTSTPEYFSAAETIVNKTDAEWGLTTVRFDYALWSFFWDQGINILNEDNTKATFNTDKTVEILSRLRELTDDGIIPKLTWTQRKQPQAQEFGTGNTGMYHMWLSSVRLVEESGDWVDGDSMGFMPAPGKKPAYNGHGWSITKNQTQATKEATLKMIKVILNTKWQKDFLRNTTVLVGNTNAMESLANSDEFRKKNPLLAGVYETWFESADGAVPQPRISQTAEIWDTINSQFSAAAVGETDPQQAVANAEQRVNDTLE